MKSLSELIATTDHAFPIVCELLKSGSIGHEILTPSTQRGDCLVKTQVTTRSPMGAIVYETGGILIDHGWLRILGSGHPMLQRTLPGWNEGRSSGFYLVADDAVGGFFALNGASLGSDLGSLYYFAPDTLAWEPMGISYSQFIPWCVSDRLQKFYESTRWASWEDAVEKLPADRCFSFYPPLWMDAADSGGRTMTNVPAAEQWSVQMDFAAQLNGNGPA